MAQNEEKKQQRDFNKFIGIQNCAKQSRGSEMECRFVVRFFLFAPDIV